MTCKNDKKVEVRKSWDTPQLKKTSIEQITANSMGCSAPDGGSGPNAHAS
jgi:hypothetical protein